METNKVNVKIYGQEYVIAGDKPREEIIQVAAHVDMKMQEIGEAAKSLGASPSNIAVLSAVNIASEYFEVLEEIEELKRLNLQLEKDAQHYVQLWDESKKNYMDYIRAQIVTCKWLGEKGLVYRWQRQCWRKFLLLFPIIPAWQISAMKKMRCW